MTFWGYLAIELYSFYHMLRAPSMKPEIHRVGVLDHEFSLVVHADANSGSALYKVGVTLIETFAGR